MKRIIKIIFVFMISISFFTINTLAYDKTHFSNLNHIDRVENSIIPKNAELIEVRESNEYLNMLNEYEQNKWIGYTVADKLINYTSFLNI